MKFSIFVSFNTSSKIDLFYCELKVITAIFFPSDHTNTGYICQKIYVTQWKQYTNTTKSIPKVQRKIGMRDTHTHMTQKTRPGDPEGLSSGVSPLTCVLIISVYNRWKAYS